MKRIVVRAKSHFSLVSVMRDGGFLKAHGLDPEFEVIDQAAVADEELKTGKADVIFGSHVTPYLHFDDGEPLVYLAQTMNMVQENFASKEPISDLSEMAGKRLAMHSLFDQEGKFAGHPRGNRELMLERAGIGGNAVECVGYGNSGRSRDRFDVIVRGEADGTFVGRQETRRAVESGLHILPLDGLPMIYFVTVTTTSDKVLEHSEQGSFDKLLRAISEAVLYFKSNPDGTLKILQNYGDLLEYQDDADMRDRYQAEAESLDPSLLPRLDSIRNAFRLAEYVRPDLSERVNPLALWDLHFAHALRRPR
jgi:ABC-type nitrate/sulfonate/bicarbonate transport system substrate-binding protein